MTSLLLHPNYFKLQQKVGFPSAYPASIMQVLKDNVEMILV